MNPSNFEANFYLGYLLKQSEDRQRARTFLEKADALRPDTFEANFQLAVIARKDGRIQEALQRLERARKTAPEEVRVHVLLAEIYFRMKRRADGEKEKKTAEVLNARKQDAELTFSERMAHDAARSGDGAAAVASKR